MYIFIYIYTYLHIPMYISKKACGGGVAPVARQRMSAGHESDSSTALTTCLTYTFFTQPFVYAARTIRICRTTIIICRSFIT